MTDDFSPLVSIIIPVYNGGKYMREAIDSAIAQTYRNIEIIVVNDGSSDAGETERIAGTYGDRIRYFAKPNGGVSSALNMGIRNMRGAYFSWLSHDDVYTPDKIEKQIRALAELEDRETLIVCRTENIDEHSQPITLAVKHDRFLPENVVLSWDTVLMSLLRDGCLNGCALLIPKSVFDRCGNFDESLRFCQDLLMWEKIFLNKYSLYCIPSACVKSRVHSGQLTQTGQALFHTDSEAMSGYMIPKLREVSTKEQNFLFEYIRFNAKHLNRNVVKRAYACAKEGNLLSVSQKVKIRISAAWGYVRPAVRRVYYAVSHKIKTT